MKGQRHGIEEGKRIWLGGLKEKGISLKCKNRELVKCPYCQAAAVGQLVRETTYTVDRLKYHIAYHHPEVKNQGGIMKGVIDMSWKKDEDELYPIWKPTKKGESVEGTVIDVRSSKFNDLLILKQKDDSMISVPIRAALQRKNFENGEVVKIEFRGKERTEDGYKVMLFDVFRAE